MFITYGAVALGSSASFWAWNRRVLGGVTRDYRRSISITLGYLSASVYAAVIESFVPTCDDSTLSESYTEASSFCVVNSHA